MPIFKDLRLRIFNRGEGRKRKKMVKGRSNKFLKGIKLPQMMI
jgi:hypothetical protein